MQLYKVRGGTEKDLNAKQYNIGIGISLGNKWFSAENIVLLMEWAIEHTKDFVVVYVADSIHAINIEVRKRKSPQKALEIAMKMGDAILEEVKPLAERRLSDEKLSRIHYERWDGLITPAFQKKLDWLNTKFQTDNNFKAEVINLVDGFTSGEKRVFDENDKIKLGSYIISEFPELLTRVPINSLSFDANAYPFDGKLLEFIEDIQNGNIFPEIREAIMDTEPKVFLEVRE